MIPLRTQENLQTIVEEHDQDVIQNTIPINNKYLVLCYIKDVKVY